MKLIQIKITATGVDDTEKEREFGRLAHDWDEAIVQLQIMRKDIETFEDESIKMPPEIIAENNAGREDYEE